MHAQIYLRYGGGANPVVAKMIEAPKVTLGSAIRSVPVSAEFLAAAEATAPPLVGDA